MPKDFWGKIFDFFSSRGPGYPVWQHTFVSPSAFSRRAVVSYWRKYVHEVLVNRLGGLGLPRKSVVRLTDRPDMTLDVYRGRKTTIQYKKKNSFPPLFHKICHLKYLILDLQYLLIENLEKNPSRIFFFYVNLKYSFLLVII